MPKKRKITLPAKRSSPEVQVKDVILLPELQNVLDDAASTVSLEIAKLKRRATVGTAPFDGETARVLQGYIKAAVDLSREYREREGTKDYDGMSDEELLDTFLDSMPKEEIRKLLQDKLNSDKE